jgi:hypothetical protein
MIMTSEGQLKEAVKELDHDTEEGYMFQARKRIQITLSYCICAALIMLTASFGVWLFCYVLQ